MHYPVFSLSWTQSFFRAVLLVAVLDACGGSSSSSDAPGSDGGVMGDTGVAADTNLGIDAAMMSSGGAPGSGGAQGTGGSAGAGPTVALPASGDHFCKIDVTEAGGWGFGAQVKCRMTVAKTPPLSASVKQGLDAGCQPPYSQVVTACPTSDAVAFCVSLDSPVLPTRTFILVNKSSITPDTTAVALNSLAICGGTAYDLTGKPLNAKCTGTVKAKVDGVMTEFSAGLSCFYKSNGVKSQYFVQAQDATRTKSFNIAILKEGNVYSVPGNAIAPGFSYIEGNSSFAFPKNADTIPLDVTKFMTAGAGLSVSSSPGELYSQPGGKGAGPRTVTDIAIDIAMAP